MAGLCDQSGRSRLPEVSCRALYRQAAANHGVVGRCLSVHVVCMCLTCTAWPARYCRAQPGERAVSFWQPTKPVVYIVGKQLSKKCVTQAAKDVKFRCCGKRPVNPRVRVCFAVTVRRIHFAVSDPTSPISRPCQLCNLLSAVFRRAIQCESCR